MVLWWPEQTNLVHPEAQGGISTTACEQRCVASGMFFGSYLRSESEEYCNNIHSVVSDSCKQVVCKKVDWHNRKQPSFGRRNFKTAFGTKKNESVSYWRLLSHGDRQLRDGYKRWVWSDSYYSWGRFGKRGWCHSVFTKDKRMRNDSYFGVFRLFRQLCESNHRGIPWC